jgi:hypothetical protein
LENLPKAGAFFTKDKARADGVFVKKIIEQLQEISTDTALRQLLWKIDQDLSCREQYKNYDVHAAFHTLWIAFFTYYPYLFSPGAVDLALEDNSLNPALSPVEAPSQFSSFLKNSWMKARIVQQKIAYQDLECIYAAIRELGLSAREDMKKNINYIRHSHSGVDSETPSHNKEISPELCEKFLGYGSDHPMSADKSTKMLSAFDKLVTHLPSAGRACAFNTLATMTLQCDIFTYHFNCDAMLLVISSLSAEQRQAAFSTLISMNKDDPMNIRPQAILKLLEQQTNLSEQELAIGFATLKGLLAETRPAILATLQFYDMSLAKHCTLEQLEYLYTRLTSLAREKVEVVNKSASAIQDFSRQMLHRLTPYFPADFHVRIIAFWTTLAPKYRFEYHTDNAALIALAPQLSSELRQALLGTLITREAQERARNSSNILDLITLSTELAIDDPLISINHLINIIKEGVRVLGASYQAVAIEQVVTFSLRLSLESQTRVLNTLMESTRKPISEGGRDAARCLIKLLLGINNLELALKFLARLSELEQIDTVKASLITEAIVKLSSQLSDNQFADAFKILRIMARGEQSIALPAIAAMAELCPRLSHEQLEDTLECVWPLADMDQSDIRGDFELATVIAQLSPRLLPDDLNRAFKILWSLATIVRGNLSEVFIRAAAAPAIAEVSLHCPQYLDKTLEILDAMITPETNDQVVQAVISALAILAPHLSSAQLERKVPTLENMAIQADEKNLYTYYPIIHPLIDYTLALFTERLLDKVPDLGLNVLSLLMDKHQIPEKLENKVRFVTCDRLESTLTNLAKAVFNPKRPSEHINDAFNRVTFFPKKGCQRARWNKLTVIAVITPMLSNEHLDIALNLLIRKSNSILIASSLGPQIFATLFMRLTPQQKKKVFYWFKESILRDPEILNSLKAWATIDTQEQCAWLHSLVREIVRSEMCDVELRVQGIGVIYYLQTLMATTATAHISLTEARVPTDLQNIIMSMSRN